MATIANFEDLEIWQIARVQAADIFLMFKEGSFSKDFALRDQINRASGSVMDNVAEGFERSGNKEFCNFLLYAKGSNGEVRSQLYRAFDRQYLGEEKFNEMKVKCADLSKRITAFIKYLKASDKKGFRYSKPG